MIVRIVRLTLKQEHLTAFERLFHAHHDAIESQPGCRGVELLTDPAHPSVRATLSRWDAESDLNAYRSSALFGEIWPATKAMFDAPPMVWTYEVKEAR